MNIKKMVQLNIDVLHIIHFIVSVWQQVFQSTIQICFVKYDYVMNNKKVMLDMVWDKGIGEEVTYNEDCV